MNRLRFRQWNPSAKNFHYWGYVSKDDAFTCPIHGESQQFTRLLDKNSKEIYEGDLLRYVNDPTGRFLWQVVFRDGCFMRSIIVGYSTVKVLKDDPHKFEVIGNIYENPELLEAK